jgi:putative transposase
MSQRAVVFALGEYYHVYNRGTDKREIYLDTADYRRFIELLYICNSTEAVNIRSLHKAKKSVYDQERKQTLVAIGAYCLMPNHFHLLLTPIQDDGVTKFMNKLGTSYSMYFNKKYERSGALFQGRFKAKMAVEDEYLKYLYAYIHLNPVKLIDSEWKDKGLKDLNFALDYLRQYRFSSLPKYLNIGGEEDVIVDEKYFPSYFPHAAANVGELTEWLQFAPD